MNAETVTLALYLDTMRNPDENLSLEEVTPYMMRVFPERTLAIAAEIFNDPHQNQDVNEWMMRGVIETAEDAYTAGKVTETIRQVAFKVGTRVEYAKVVAASSKFKDGNISDLRRLRMSLEKQSSIAILKKLQHNRETGNEVEGAGDDDATRRAEVSLLILNLISPITTRDIAEQPDIYLSLDRIYAEQDRILPYLPEFEKRGSFSFEVLDELEQAPSQVMIDGIL